VGSVVTGLAGWGPLGFCFYEITTFLHRKQHLYETSISSLLRYYLIFSGRPTAPLVVPGKPDDTRFYAIFTYLPAS